MEDILYLFSLSRARRSLLLTAVLSFCHPAHAEDVTTIAPNVEAYMVTKGQHWQQHGPNPPALASNMIPFRFNASVTPAFPGAVSNVTLRTPTGRMKVLTNEFDQFGFEQGFASRSALDSAFTNGTYIFTIRTQGDGVRTPSLVLPPISYPGVPHIANWEAAQDIDATADFTLVWDAFNGGSSNDFIYAEIKDLSSQSVWGSPGFLEQDALNGTALSITIPAQTLSANQIYQARLLFVKRTGLNLTSYPNAAGISGYYRETFFNMIASPPPPPQGRLQFSASAYEVNETAGTATIVITRTSGSQGDVSVNFTTSNGTADSADYVANFGTLQLADGQTAQTFQVTVQDDFQLEGNETINLSLNTPGGAAILASPSNAVLRILDNELAAAGVLQFSATNYVVNETSRVALLTVTRTGGAIGTVTVDYSCSDGSANAGLDYTNVSGMLIFTPQQTSRTIVVPIDNDTIDENTEAFFVSLNRPSDGAALGLRQTARVVIGDNDSGGIIHFQSAAYSVDETGQVAVITLVRSNGAASQVRVDYATTGGTAAANDDYAPVSGTIEFGANQTRQTFTIPVFDDDFGEGNETVTLRLGNPAGGARLGAATNAVLNILDDEVALQFSRDTYSVSETSAVATITIVRSGPTNNAASVNYFTRDGTANDGSDYTARSGTLTLGAGVRARTFAIPVVNDTIVEEPETVNLTLSDAGQAGVLLGSRTNAVLTILDNDVGGLINFRLAAYKTNENSPQALIAVTRTGGAASGVTINFETSDGTAMADTHYLPTNGTLSFGANQTVKTFAVPIINNTLDEPSRSVLLHLSEPTGGATLSALSNAVLTLVDDDSGGVIAFRTNLFRRGEAAGMATITVVRTGRASDVTVDFSTSDGTATDGEDYLGSSGTLSFEAGEISQTFTIELIDNDEDTPNRTVLLRLSNPTGRATLGAPANAVLTILDDDVSVEGLYKISGSVTDSGCTYQPNGTMSFKGDLLFYEQVGNEFQGTGLLISTTRGGAIDISLSGTVDGSGRFSADYSSDSGGVYGTMTGTVSGKSLQVSFNGREEFDTCRHSGTLSGNIYAPGSAGYAPAFVSGLSVVARITGGSGVYDRSGTFQIDFSEFDHDYELFTDEFDAESGVYLYTKTGPNTASLLTHSEFEGITTTTTITFTSATTGTYSSTGIGVTGTQTGTFRLSDPFEE